MRYGMVAATVAAMFLATGTAQAGTVSMNGAAFSYVAGPQEVNHVTITRHPGAFEIDDRSVVPLIAGPGCTLVALNRATCPATFTGEARVVLGDGHDSARTLVDPGVTQGFTLDGGTGDDQLQGAAGADRVDGGPGRDYLHGYEGNDVMLPGPDSERDTLDAATGVDTVSYAGSPFANVVTLGEFGEGGVAGEDDLRWFEDAIGGDGDDSITGTDGENRLAGGAGNDTLTGAGADDTLRGGDGDDTADGGDGLDSVSGDAGDDTLLGGAARDNLYGEAGHDVLDAGDGDDNLHGDAGDDTLLGGDGADYMSGAGGTNLYDGGAGPDDFLGWGSASDTVTYASRTAPVFVTVFGEPSVLSPDDDGEAGEADDLVMIETVIGGAGDDVLVGHDGTNTFAGGAGADRLDGRGGADVLTGGDGVDAFLGGAGDDAVHARDRLIEEIACGDGTDTVTADPRDAAARDCETVARGVK